MPNSSKQSSLSRSDFHRNPPLKLFFHTTLCYCNAKVSDVTLILSRQRRLWWSFSIEGSRFASWPWRRHCGHGESFPTSSTNQVRSSIFLQLITSSYTWNLFQQPCHISILFISLSVPLFALLPRKDKKLWSLFVTTHGRKICLVYQVIKFRNFLRFFYT